MNDEDYKWLSANFKLLGNVRMTNGEAKQLFDIYNRVTNENKPMTTCGRCVYNVKQRLKIEYDIIQSLRNKDR